MHTRKEGPTSTHTGETPFCKVTAIVRMSRLELVEKRLQQLRLPGISVTKVKGYGEFAAFSRPDWIVEHARIEIFLRRERAEEVALAIVETARTGLRGDGIVVILPVESLHHVRAEGDGSENTRDDQQ